MATKALRFTHPGQPQMFAEVIAASRHAITGRKVFTLHLRYPRILHGEVMTHRVFNRNARSSRAVPVKTLLAEIRSSAFVPWHWTGIQKGMQGIPNWSKMVSLKDAAALHTEGSDSVTNEAAWLWGRDMMCDLAESFADAGYHKQVANRLVEPWMWMDLLVTSTHWANFLHLRDHPDAEPHIRDLAVLVGKAIEAADCVALLPGEWHMPYITEEDRVAVRREHRLLTMIKSQLPAGEVPSPSDGELQELLMKVSAARCARISYKPFDGNASLQKELERYELLVGNDAVHASPLEHQCTPDYADRAPHGFTYSNPQMHGPLTGFIQFRKTVPNEAVHD